MRDMVRVDERRTTVDSVRYYELDDDLGAYYGHFSAAGHTVDMGVELIFTSGMSLSLIWVNPRQDDGGYTGYLVVVDQPMEVVAPDPDLQRYVVTDWPEWREYRGDSVARIEHTWDPLSHMRLAARLWFRGNSPITVALGGADPTGAVEYQINGLVVFHRDAVAGVYLDHLSRRELRVSADTTSKAMGTRGT